LTISLRKDQTARHANRDSLPACFAIFASLYAQAPVFGIEPQESSITFHVKASTTLTGKFDKWTASLNFASPDGTTGVLEIKIEAASVDSGSGLKNGKLKNKDFFDIEQIH
jgi:polyisoprenoid-binding protein YceI